MLSDHARRVIEWKESTGEPWKLVILVTGSRAWTDKTIVGRILQGLDNPYEPGQTLVVHGDARGADKIADAWALRNGTFVAAFPADWEGLGKSAGPRRNQEMVNYVAQQPRHVCIAFKTDFDRTLAKGGTEDCVRRAKLAGIHTYIIQEAPDV